MVRIRFRREGSRHQPFYRLVVTEKESPRDGRFLEIIGHYNPRTQPATMDVLEERLIHWLKAGALPSESALKVLQTCGAWGRWERVKQGEALEAVMASRPTPTPVDPRTRRLAAGAGTGKKKVKKAEAAAEAPAEA